jgi:hypothetical protein
MLTKIRNPENQDFLSCRSQAAAYEVEDVRRRRRRRRRRQRAEKRKKNQS